MSFPSLSIVICAYADERWDDLTAAVASAQKQTECPTEIIIVIDHNPALFRRAREHWPNLAVVENNQERGLGGARNSGFAAATGEIVAYLDDDAVAAPDWSARLMEAYQSPEVFGAGGMIEPVWQGGKPSWFPDEFAWVVGCTYRGMPSDNQSVRNLMGCNMSYRRRVVADLGGFRLGYGCDETEFCIRLHHRWPEAKLLYVPAGRVTHNVRRSRATFRYFLTRCYFEGGSKAVVAHLLGGRDGLASERAYTFRTLPLGVARGMLDTIHGRTMDGLAQSSAIIAGLAATTAGYGVGRATLDKAARRRGWSGPLPGPSPRSVTQPGER